MNLLSRFIPSATDFFSMLRQQSALMTEAADLLYATSYINPDAERVMQRLTLLEVEADKLNTSISREISLTFITPIDREDLSSINLAQERVIDGIHTLGRQMFLDNFARCRFPAEKMIRNMAEMARATARMLDRLASKQDVAVPMRELKALRDDSDAQADIGIVEFLDKEALGVVTAREMILWTRRYDNLGHATALLSDLADLLEQVSLKYV